VISTGPILTGGSKKTMEFAAKHNKPCLHINSGQSEAAQALRDFVADNEIATLNVAGPRASKEPDVGDLVREVLDEAFPRKLAPLLSPAKGVTGRFGRASVLFGQSFGASNWQFSTTC
jgi:Circularly permutated YpsA SLOG family